MNYDVIGDIHGQSEKLEALLKLMGYRERGGSWRHPDRMAVFVGDFIDRGEKGVETVRIVRGMVDAGRALAVMGNHELNAIAWHTPHPEIRGEYLRRRYAAGKGERNRRQHQAFLAQVEHEPVLHKDIIDWFLTLPLWLEEKELRVVHACWHEPYMRWLSPRLYEGRYLTPELMVDATQGPLGVEGDDDAGPSIFAAVEALTKGIEMELPEPHSFLDKDGIQRRHVRARWWDTEATTYRASAVMPARERQALPDISVPAHARLPVPTDKPIFFGHYWMKGAPALQSPSAVCVDYSAGAGGPLVAFRLDGSAPVSDESFVYVGASNARWPA